MLGFGVTHIARPEDWPIMPVEILRVHLKPSGFFDVGFIMLFHYGNLADLLFSFQRNPGLDVPSSADKKSRNADEALVNGVKGVHIDKENVITPNGVKCKLPS